MNCPNDSRLLAYLRGEATAEEGQHIHDCAACQLVMEGLDNHPDAQVPDVRSAAALPPVVSSGPCSIPVTDIGTTPQRVGKYELREALGSGGMAIVFSAAEDES